MDKTAPFDEKLYEALYSLPEEALGAPKEKLLGLWQRLCSLPEKVLGEPGRFMYNPISALRDDDFYLIGINPSVDRRNPKKNEIKLRDEILAWTKEKTHAIDVEDWGTEYQRTVEALCRAVGKDLHRLCASNFYFVRAADTDTLREKLNKLVPKDVQIEQPFWDVHKAVIEIIRPKSIFVISDTIFDIMLSLLRCSQKNVVPLYSDNKEYRCRAVVGENKDRPLMIGIPYPRQPSRDSRKQPPVDKRLTSYPEVLDKIAAMVNGD